MVNNFNAAEKARIRRAQRRSSALVWFSIALIVIAFITVLAAFIWGVGTLSCSNRWGDYTHEFRVAGGCMVEIDGRMTPEDKVRF